MVGSSLVSGLPPENPGFKGLFWDNSDFECRPMAPSSSLVADGPIP